MVKKELKKPRASTRNDADNSDPNKSTAGRGDTMGLCERGLHVGKYALLLLALPPFLNYAALQREGQHLQPAGNLYDIGFGQKLFLSCLGEGAPTVILDAPTGMSSDAWAAVHAELAQTTKVCVYDRAGLGYSERPTKNYSAEAEPQSRDRWKEYTVERMVDDLHRLITASSHQPQPFILVGSEMGTLVSRFYTQIYETDVSDLVLIDPLVEDIFTQDNGVWLNFWFSQLVPSFQSLQLCAAAGVTRILLLLGVMEVPINGPHIPEDIQQRQKYLLCHPRHLSTVVDEHHFINATFSQMQTIMGMKQFPRNVSVTVITGNYYDEQLPSSLNKAWAKSQQQLMSRFHPGSHHIVVNGADHHMLYRQPQAIIEPIRRVIRNRKNLLQIDNQAT